MDTFLSASRVDVSHYRHLHECMSLLISPLFFLIYILTPPNEESIMGALI